MRVLTALAYPLVNGGSPINKTTGMLQPLLLARFSLQPSDNIYTQMLALISTQENTSCY